MKLGESDRKISPENPMINDETILTISENVSYQSMGEGEDTVLLSLTSGRLYTCNQTTTDLLNAIDGKRNFGQIVELVAEQYDVEIGRLRNDLANMAERLESEGLLATSSR